MIILQPEVKLGARGFWKRSDYAFPNRFPFDIGFGRDCKVSYLDFERKLYGSNPLQREFNPYESRLLS